MTKPSFEDVMKARCKIFKRGMNVHGWDDDDVELAGNAFKDGYSHALKDFAVSEMIDALIDARIELISFQHMYPYSTVVQSCIEQIELALKKAGVES